MWGKRKDIPTGIPEHIVRRVGMLPTGDLVEWADQAIYTTGRYLTLHQRTRDLADLDEALTGAQVLLAITEEMRRRAD